MVNLHKYNNLQVVKPFFVNEKYKLNQEYQKIEDEKLKQLIFPKYFCSRTQKLETHLSYHFPMHITTDIVKRHNEGYWNQENIDLFNFFHRMFLKNKYFFDKKFEKIRKNLILESKQEGNEYKAFFDIPLPIKKFIIEKNLLDIKIYEELLLKYQEEKNLEELLMSSSPNYKQTQKNLRVIDLNALKLSLQSDHQILLEENFLVNILEKANIYGLRCLSPIELIEFKKIVDKRKKDLNEMSDALNVLDKSSKMQNNLQISKHFRTKTMMAGLSIDYSRNHQKSEHQQNKNSNIIETLNKWKSVKKEGAEYLYLAGESKHYENTENKQNKGFNDMLNKLKQVKNQTSENNNNENKIRNLANLGKLALRLESVKINLLKRLNLGELQTEISTFNKINNPNLLLSKYSHILSENKTNEISPTKQSANINTSNIQKERLDASFLSKNRELLKEISPENVTVIEKSNFSQQKKKTAGKRAKFHRFSMIVIKNEEPKNFPNLPKENNFEENRVEMKVEKNEIREKNNLNRKNKFITHDVADALTEKLIEKQLDFDLPIPKTNFEKEMKSPKKKESEVFLNKKNDEIISHNKQEKISKSLELRRKKRFSDDFGIKKQDDLSIKLKRNSVYVISQNKLEKNQQNMKLFPESKEKNPQQNRALAKLSKFSRKSIAKTSHIEETSNQQPNLERKSLVQTQNIFENPSAWENHNEDSPDLMKFKTEKKNDPLKKPQKNHLLKNIRKNSSQIHPNSSTLSVEIKNGNSIETQNIKKNKTKKAVIQINNNFQNIESKKNSIYSIDPNTPIENEIENRIQDNIFPKDNEINDNLQAQNQNSAIFDSEKPQANTRTVDNTIKNSIQIQNIPIEKEIKMDYSTKTMSQNASFTIEPSKTKNTNHIIQTKRKQMELLRKDSENKSIKFSESHDPSFENFDKISFVNFKAISNESNPNTNKKDNYSYKNQLFFSENVESKKINFNQNNQNANQQENFDKNSFIRDENILKKNSEKKQFFIIDNNSNLFKYNKDVNNPTKTDIPGENMTRKTLAKIKNEEYFNEGFIDDDEKKSYNTSENISPEKLESKKSIQIKKKKNIEECFYFFIIIFLN